MSKQGAHAKSKSAQASPNKTQDISPSSTAKTAFEDIIRSAKALANDQDVQRMLELFDKVPSLEEQIKSKDSQIEKLSIDIKNQFTDHQKAHRQSLSTYEASADEMKREITEKSDSITSLQRELEQRDTTIEKMTTVEAALRSNIADFERNAKAQDERKEKAESTIEELRASTEDARATNEELQENARKNDAKLTKLQAELKRCQTENETLTNECRHSARQLEYFKSFTIALDRDDPDNILRELDQVWGRASQLISSTFFKDLPEAVLKNDDIWNHLKKSQRWNSTIPLPQSNSEVSQQMRVAVLLANLARVIDHHIFQPTYFLPVDSGIRGLLTRLARQDVRKESLFRGLILSLLPNEQDTAGTQRVTQARDEVMQDIRGLLAGPEEGHFRTGLEDVIESARSAWEKVLRSGYAVELRFDVQHYVDWNWHRLRFDGKAVVIDSDAASANVEKEEEAVAIIPQIYIADEEGYGPVTHGVVLTRSQMLVAQHELGQVPSSPGVGRSNSALSRFGKPRKMSTGSETNRVEPDQQSFLARFLPKEQSDGRKPG